jgi:hypothetical protein
LTEVEPFLQGMIMPDPSPTLSTFIPPQSVACTAPSVSVTIALRDDYQSLARFFEMAPSKRALIYLPGIQSHSGWFVESADYLRQQGATVLMPDRRGSGLHMQSRASPLTWT